MPCVPISPAMRQLLEALTAWPDVDTEVLRRRPEWALGESANSVHYEEYWKER